MRHAHDHGITCCELADASRHGFDDIHARLAAAGATFSDKEFCKDRIWMVTCRDPNGIFIEFQQYTEDSMQLKGGVCEVDYTP